MRQEAIYKGATRPAMKFGVPLVPLVVLFGLAMLAVVWGGLLVSWWIAAVVCALVLPTLGWMRLVTAKDDQRFAQIVIWTRLRIRSRNQRKWRCRSYSPIAFRGATDARV